MTKPSLIKLIHDSIANRKPEPKRSYIGASSIGAPCMRQIWYGFKGYEGEGIGPELQLTFDIGKSLETLLLDYIISEMSGWQSIIDRSLEDNEIEFFKGTPDFMVYINYPRDNESLIILELKTAKNSSFLTFKNKGLKIWSMQYYDQLQSYMGMSGAKQGVLLAINKDTSELHEEWVDFEEPRYEYLKNKAMLIANAEFPPDRINNSPMFYLCKMCKFKGICHE